MLQEILLVELELLLVGFLFSLFTSAPINQTFLHFLETLLLLIAARGQVLVR